MMRVTSLVCAFALLGLGLTACGSETEVDGGGTDSGDDTDSFVPPPDQDPVGFGDMLGALTPADYSCLGMNAAPGETGAASTFDGEVTDFFTDDPVEGLTIQFFPDNAPSADGTCTGTCIEVVSGATGTVSVMDAQDSWYSYRIVGGSGMIPAGAQDYIEVVQFNEVAPATGGSETMNAVQASTRDTIVALLGVMVEAGTATMTGQVFDCADNSIANASFRIFDSSGEIATGFRPTGTRAFYYNGDSFPSAPQRLTHVDGLYGAANVPLPADDTVRVEIWGVLNAGEAAVMLGCEQIQVVEDGITITNVGPARSDGPSACGS